MGFFGGWGARRGGRGGREGAPIFEIWHRADNAEVLGQGFFYDSFHVFQKTKVKSDSIHCSALKYGMALMSCM